MEKSNITGREEEKMKEFEHDINLATLSEEELNNIAGGRDPFALPPGVDITKPYTCSRCGADAYIDVFSWGQTGADGTYYPDAWVATYKCRNCGNYWRQGIIAGESD